MVAPILMAAAPIVTSLLQTGLGILGNAVAAKGKDYIEGKLGVDIDKMMGSEEGRIKLAQIEAEKEEMLQQFALEKRNQELKADEMAFSDVSSARGMQMEALKQTDVFSKRFLYYFSIVWSAAGMFYIGFITFGNIPEANIRFADTILGFVLGSILATMFNFFYGSSKGSQSKDSTIAEAIKGIKNG